MPFTFTSFSDFVLDQVFGYQSANKLKNNTEALLGWRVERDLGGSREMGVQGSGALDVPEFREKEIISTNVTGMTIRARVNTRTNNAGTSVQPKVRNVSDSSDTVTGTSHTSTSFTEELLAVTPVSGTKRYKMMVITNNANNLVFGFGHLEAYL
jgi:hypothetical protein